MKKRARRLLSLVLVMSMLATSAVPALATEGSADVDTAGQTEASGSTSLTDGTGDDTNAGGDESSESESSTEETTEEESTEAAPGPGEDSEGSEDPDGEPEEEPGEETEDPEPGDGSATTDPSGGNDLDLGRTDGVYDPQPEEPEEVQEWVDFYVASDYAESAKPYWEHEVDAYLIPEGWECVFIADDGYFGASYFTLRQLYPPDEEDGDGEEDGKVSITAENVTVPLGDTGFDLLDGVSATDEKGEDISDQVIVLADGGFDVEEAGEYTVTYAVLDVEEAIVTAAQRVVTVDSEAGDGEDGDGEGDENGEGEVPPEETEPELNADTLYLLVDAVQDEMPHYTYVPGAFLKGVTAYDAEGNDITDLVEIIDYGELEGEPSDGELLPMGEYIFELAVVQDGEVLLEGTRDVIVMMGIVPTGDTLTHMVRWYDWDGRLVSIQFVAPGARAQEPRTNDRPDYAFVGWSVNGSVVDETTWQAVDRDLDLIATYKPLGTKLMTVQYHVASGIPIAAPFVAEVPIEADYILTVPTPGVAGYTPDRTIVNIDLSLYDGDHTETVLYTPSAGTAEVVYMLQDLNGTTYTRAPESYTYSGLVGDTVHPAPQTYEGFEQINNPTGTVLADGSAVIRVYFDRLSYAVYYDANGGYFIEPKSYLYGETINYPVADVDIRKGGYLFDGWNASPSQYQDNLPATMPATDLYLTAKWRLGAPVRYTVMYWVEQADDSAQTYDQELAANGGTTNRGYDYVGSVSTYTAYADSKVNAPSGTAGVTFPDNLINYTSRNNTKTDSNVTVSGDGDTILNVYYDRNLYVVQLSTQSYVPGASSPTGTYHSWTYGGVTYGNGSSDVNRYLVKGKYGDNIAASWPNSGPTTKTSLSFSGWSNPTLGSTTLGTKRHEMTDSLVAVSSTVNNPYKLYCAFQGNTTYNINYHLQRVDQADTPYTSFPRDANLSQTLQGSSNSTWSAKLVKGFKLVSPDGLSGSTINFYFQRNRYKIDFANGGVVNTAKTINQVHYEKPLSSYASHWIPTTSDAPAGLEGYVFAGWTTQDGTPFNFNTATMPAGNLALFATWERPSHKATLYLNDGTNTVYATEDVLLHDSITEPADPTRPGYVFAGWYREQNPAAGALKYVFDFPITGPENLYARWVAESNIKYTVKYYREGESTPFYTYDDYGNMDEQVVAYALGKTELDYYNLGGYFVDKYEKSFTLSANEEQNVIEFFYKKAQDVPYWVHYVQVEKDEFGNEVVVGDIASVKAQITDYNIVTEDYLPVSGYWTETYQITLPLSLTYEDNHIYFKYTANEGVMYTVYHYLQNLDTSEGGYPDAKDLGMEYVEILTGPVASTATATVRDYPGFTYAPGISKVSGVITSDGLLELHVYYTRNSYTVNFESNGGSAVASQSNVLFEELVIEPFDPVRTGYTFRGWYSDPAFTTTWNFATNTMPANDLTLYARWSAKTGYTLRFEYEGADSGNSEASRGATFDQPLGALPSPGRTGYTFGGWFDQKNGQGKQYLGTSPYDVDGDLTLYAHWKANQQTVKYHANGANGVTPQTDDVDYDSTYIIKSAADLSMTHPYSWRIFAGWKEGAVTYAAGQSVIIKGDMELFAQWVYDGVTTFTVTYDANGGTGSYAAMGLAPESTHTVLAPDNALVGIDRYGFNFLGWNTEADGSGTAYAPNSTFLVLGDVTLYAQWKHNGTDFFNVTYEANDYGQGPNLVGPNIIPGETDKVLALSDTSITNRYDGWLFDGWNTQKDGLGASYAPGEDIVVNSNVILYAQWKHDGKTFYSVAYLPNGGQGGMIDSNLIPGDPYTVKTQVQANVTRTGDWNFKNWTTINGSPVVYNEGQVIANLTSPLFLYAEWEYYGAKVTVTYDANRGEGSYSEQVNPGANYTVVSDVTANITRYGHDFVEWNDKADGTGKWYKEGTVDQFTSDVTLYAQWAWDGKTYVNVIYNANKGVGTKSVPVIPGEDHVVLSDSAAGVSRLGHDFVNWNAAANGNGSSYTAGNIVTPINSDITLYAQWKYDNTTKVTLSYDANGGTGAHAVPGITPGETVTLINNNAAGIARKGHYFMGWNTEADGSGAAYAAGETFQVDADTTVYAQWEWDGVTYVALTYDANGGTNSHTVADIIPGETSVVIDPADVTPKISRYGFDFLGWNTKADGSGAAYAPGEIIKVDDDMTLYAQWKHDGKTFYKVYYMPNGGTGNHIVDVIPGSEHTIVNLSDTTITRSGYDFNSWNTAAAGTGITRNPGEKITVTGPTILYAKWDQIITYQVTYDANGGQGSYTGSPILSGQSDVVMTLSQTGISRNGHKFDGWEDGGGTFYAPGSFILMNSDVTLYAQWTWDGKTLVNITYDANGGTGGGNGPSLKPGEVDKVLSPTDASLNVARAHYDFQGWNTKADGTGAVYQPGTDVQLHDGMTLYAQWKWDGTYVTVTYNANGGTDGGTIQAADPDDEVKIQLIPGDQHTVLSADDFSFERRGHDFIGWGTDDVETPVVVYVPGDVITVDDDVYLYASWYYDQSAQVTITYDANGGTGTNSVSVVPGRSVSLRNGSSHGIERKGYDFVGWALDPNGPAVYTPGNGVVYFKTNNNVTLYAIWSVNPNTRVNVNYHANGGVGNDYSDLNLTPGSSYTMLAPTASALNYSKYGYNFTGWNTKEDGKGASYSAGDVITIEGDDIDLYAQWKHDGKTYYQVFYMPSGGSGYAIDNVIPGSSYTVRTGAQSTVTKAGYVVAYWNTSADGAGDDYAGGDEIVPTGNLLMYAQWIGSDVTYKVAYNANEGEGSYLDTGVSPVGRYTVKTAAKTGISREGYDLANWDTKAAGTGYAYEAGEKIILKGDTDLFAQWSPKEGYEFTVRYDSNGADGATTSYDGGSYTYQQAHTVVSGAAAGFSHSTADFKDWNTKADGSGTSYAANSTIWMTQHVTLYAQWEATPQDRNITYHGNHGTGSAEVTEYNLAADPYTVRDVDVLGPVSIAGLTFDSWNTKADGTGATYAPNQPLPPSGDIDLYAMWNYDGFTVCRVTYMPNTAYGGLGAPKIVTSEPLGYTILDPATINITHPTLTFAGWNTAMDGSGTRYLKDDVIALPGNLVLFAEWI